jgi:NAD(P)-dependent dehydrogenase (short-subunit alcohol dehydrogenase family)
MVGTVKIGILVGLRGSQERLMMTVSTHTKAPALFDLSGKAAIVTGSGRGLGRAMATGLAEAGAGVVVSGRTADIVHETAEILRAKGYDAIDVVFDALDRDDCQRLVDMAVEHFGRLDVMVVNHGIGRAKPAEEIEADEWREMIAINLTGAFNCAQMAGRRMIAQGGGGSIIFTSSNASLVAFDGLTSYSASKAGVDHLARQLALEWGEHAIRVNTINPGYMTNQMRGSNERYDDAAEVVRIESHTPLARKGAPEELVGPVVFLASDASSFVTGHVMPVDGGWCIL